MYIFLPKSQGEIYFQTRFGLYYCLNMLILCRSKVEHFLALWVHNTRKKIHLWVTEKWCAHFSLHGKRVWEKPQLQYTWQKWRDCRTETGWENEAPFFSSLSGDYLRTSAYENNPFKYHIFHCSETVTLLWQTRKKKLLNFHRSLVASNRGAANKGVTDTVLCWV